MKSAIRAVAFAGLLALGVTEATAQNISVDGVYLTDDQGWSYGMSFTVSNGFSVAACIYPRVTEATNVTGAVTPGPVLLQAGERGVNIGQFIAASYGQAWSVNVEATADDSCY